jgi:hypothetical protein
MAEEGKSWWGRGKFGRGGRGDLATQAAVLLPVMAIAVLSAWTMGARGQSVDTAPPALATVQNTSLLKPEPTAVEPNPPRAVQGAAVAPGVVAPAATVPAATVPAAAVPAAEPSSVAGLKIASQSWRRGGLGSNALFNFTLRNTNDYAVGDIQVACTFTRRDGSALTERKRVLPDAVVSTRSRKTFARVHIGFVNVNADKAKCALVAASRL